MRHPSIDSYSADNSEIICRSIGTQIIQQALHELEVLGEKHVGVYNVRHLFTGTTDPLLELETFLDSGIDDVVETFRLHLPIAGVKRKFRELLAKAKAVRAKHPLKADKNQPTPPSKSYSASRLISLPELLESVPQVSIPPKLRRPRIPVQLEFITLKQFDLQLEEVA